MYGYLTHIKISIVILQTVGKVEELFIRCVFMGVVMLGSRVDDVPADSLSQGILHACLYIDDKGTCRRSVGISSSKDFFFLYFRDITVVVFTPDIVLKVIDKDPVVTRAKASQMDEDREQVVWMGFERAELICNLTFQDRDSLVEICNTH